MLLLSLEYYNSGGTIKRVELGTSLKDAIIVQPVQEIVEIRLANIVEVDGEIIRSDKPIVLKATSKTQVPVVDTNGDPKLDAEGNARTVTEFWLWMQLLFFAVPPFPIEQAMIDAIKRRLIEQYGATFSVTPNPLVFVEP